MDKIFITDNEGNDVPLEVLDILIERGITYKEYLEEEIKEKLKDARKD